jgi:hypothetical protein
MHEFAHGNTLTHRRNLIVWLRPARTGSKNLLATCTRRNTEDCGFNSAVSV